MKNWKTIKIGETKNYDEALKKAGINVSSYAQELLDKMPSNKKESIDLVKMSVKELGFDERATIEEIFNRIKELGGELCSAEVGVALRLDYLDQPLGEWLLIAMQPIFDSVGFPFVFCLVRYEGGLWLYDGWALPDNEWNPDDKFVFRIRESLEPFGTLTPLGEAILTCKNAGYEVIKRM